MYKINVQKSVSFLYTYNELSEREIKKKILLKIVSKRIKYLQINLTKKVKDMHSENYKTRKNGRWYKKNGKIHCAYLLE